MLYRNLRSMIRKRKEMMVYGVYQTNLRSMFTSHPEVVNQLKLTLAMKDFWVLKCFSIQNFSIKTGEHHSMKWLITVFNHAQSITEENFIKI